MPTVKTDTHIRRGSNYWFSPKHDPHRFFWFPRRVVTDGHWRDWPSNACAVLPALLSFADNQTGKCWPSIDTLARVCGIDRKTATDGIDFLSRCDPYRVKRAKKAKPNGQWKYYFTLPVLTTDTQGMRFPFRQSVIVGGNWSQTNQSGKRLYCVMRAFTEAEGTQNYDEGEYDEDEGGIITPFGLDADTFARRRFEICDAERGLLMNFSGLKSAATFSDAVRSLGRCALLDVLNEADGFKVNLTPRGNFARSLNQKFHPI